MAGTIAGAALPGCGKIESDLNGGPEASGAPASAKPSSVPLRVSMFGKPSDGDTIRRGWSAVSDQTIELTTMTLDRSNPIDATTFLDAARKTDVIVYPMAMVGEASSTSSIIEFSDADLQSVDESAGPLLVALRNATRFAGKRYAIPIGARLPAIISTEVSQPLSDWDEYDRWVKDDLGGRAAEPITEGWAGMMFLWRAATAIQGTWLFSRENMAPVVANENYVGVLRRMARTVKHYAPAHSGPAEIWNRLAEGKLRAAIGFPETRPIENLSIKNLPGEESHSRVLLDAYAPAISLSSGCRQSAVAKRFIKWMSGGDGSENVRKQIPSMTLTRSANGIASSEPVSVRRDSYETWLTERLKSTTTLPMIQLDRASSYYHQLDRQVTRCLHGEASPEQALRDVSRRWQDLTMQVGIEKQLRQWRRCQGMRA